MTDKSPVSAPPAKTPAKKRVSATQNAKSGSTLSFVKNEKTGAVTRRSAATDKLKHCRPATDVEIAMAGIIRR